MYENYIQILNIYHSQQSTGYCMWIQSNGAKTFVISISIWYFSSLNVFYNFKLSQLRTK